MSRILLFFALCIICPINSLGICGEAYQDVDSHTRSEVSVCKSGSGINVGAWLASFFRDHISAVDSDRCPSYPSCSSYSVAAFKKHGFVMGWLMTVDRLIHEGDEASMSPLVYENGHVKIFDPVENNDFWWSCKDGK
jgi:hypothetical protein